MAYKECYMCDYCGAEMVSRSTSEGEFDKIKWGIRLSSVKLRKGYDEPPGEDPLLKDLLFCDLDCCGMWFALMRCNAEVKSDVKEV